MKTLTNNTNGHPTLYGKRYIPFIAILSLCFLWSCAKDKSYEEVYKETGTIFQKGNLVNDNGLVKANAQGIQVQGADLKDSNNLWIYVPSQGAASRTSELIRPYTVGIERLVKLQFTESELQMLELEPDDRYRDNEFNAKLALSIPVKHLDYRCQENSIRECSNKEEVNNEIPWHQRKYYKPDVKGLKVHHVSVLSADIQKYFNSCSHSETSKKLVKYEIEDDRIYVEIDRSYKVDPDCANLANLHSVADLNFTTRYTYSLMRLNKLKSANFEATEYKKGDNNVFGFFSTSQRKLSIDGKNETGLTKTFINKWNNKNKTVTYLLDNNFYKPKNKVVLSETVKAVKKINESLTKANAGFEIKLEKAGDKKPNDVKNTTIILVEDPIASGLLGYGPSIANPLTGEILSARVVMYLGVLKQQIKTAYNDFVAVHNKKLVKPTAPKNTLKWSEELINQGLVTPLAKSEASDVNAETSVRVDKQFEKALNSLKKHQDGHNHGHQHHEHLDFAHDKKAGQIPNQFQLAQLQKRIYQKRIVGQGEASLRDKFDKFSKMNFFPSEFHNFAATVNNAFSDGVLKVVQGQASSPWDELSEEEKEDIMNKMLPYVWTSTLVHEIGHTIGLRHNFEGSSDKANFYSPTELILNGSLSGKKVTTSSVMDYMPSDLNNLPFMGKYDIAALRFGYAGEVEHVDANTGSSKGFKKVADKSLFELRSQGVNLKSYSFCTDENVGGSALCNRFDEGTTISEVALFHIERYKKNFSLRNYRNCRLFFSRTSDAAYANWIYGSYMLPLRSAFETHDTINNLYPGLPAEVWQTNDFLKEIKQATLMGADHLLSILKTPTVHCAVALKANTAEVAVTLPLSQLSQFAVSCFDKNNIRLPEQFTMIGEFGNHFNHKKDPYATHESTGSQNQIDIRGMWMDKLLALDTLFQRNVGHPAESVNQYNGNYLDIPEVAPKLLNTLVAMIMDKSPTDVTIKDESGADVLSGTATVENASDNNIEFSYSFMANYAFGLSEAKNRYLEKVILRVKGHLRNNLDSGQGHQLAENLHVYTKMNQLSGVEDPSTLNVIKTSRGTFIATPENVIANMVIAKLQSSSFVDSLSEETKKLLIAKIVDGTLEALPAAATPEYTALVEEFVATGIDEAASLNLVETLRSVNPTELVSALSGQNKSVDYYTSVLDILSKNPPQFFIELIGQGVIFPSN